MKLKVPYFRSKTNTDCGPLALKMVLAYFGISKSFSAIAKAERQLSSGLVWTAGIACAARIFGYRVKMICMKNFNHEDGNIHYYKKHVNEEAFEILLELLDEAHALDVEIEEKDLSLDELLTYVGTNCLPIVLVNWRVISGQRGFSGHFMPLVGFDDEFVYVHNPGMFSAQAYFPIARSLFVKAWESKGTNKDVVVVYRK